jgi:uncharacterized protein (TIGR02172 family)
LKEIPSTPIAQGRTSEIYTWGEQHILKLFHEWCPPDWVKYEARIAGAIYAAGVPTPAPGEIIEVDNRRGLIYERLDGISMLKDMNAHPWTILKHARSLAELQVQINQQSIAGLPSYKARLSYDISNTPHLSDRLRNKALSQLEMLPDESNLCHGDYHPGNILLTKKGLIIIDWMTACAGSPWADVARTSLILSVGAKSAGKQVHRVIRMMIKLYHRTYLNRYRRLIPDTEAEMNRWMPVIAAARLNENIVPEREALIEMMKKGT